MLLQNEIYYYLSFTNQMNSECKTNVEKYNEIFNMGKKILAFTLKSNQKKQKTSNCIKE